MANREFQTTELRIAKNLGGVVVSVQRLWWIQCGHIHIGDKMPGPETDYALMNKGKKFVSQRELTDIKNGTWSMVHCPVEEEWRELPVVIDDGVIRGIDKGPLVMPPGFKVVDREGD